MKREGSVDDHKTTTLNSPSLLTHFYSMFYFYFFLEHFVIAAVAFLSCKSGLLAAARSLMVVVFTIVAIGRWKLITDATLDTFWETLTVAFTKYPPEEAREPIV